MKLICSVTADYIPKAIPFFGNARCIKSVDLICITYKFNACAELQKAYPHFKFVHLAPVISESFGMIQHGRFLDAFDPGSDLVCLCDTDILIQRDFNASELAFFEAIEKDTLAVSYNADAMDTIGKEAKRIDYAGDTPDEDKPLYNCGVMVGYQDIFRRVQDEYENDCQDFYSKTCNRSRCQMQFWRAWHRMPGRKQIKLLPKLIHQHGHFGFPKNLTAYELAQTMFRHRL